MEKMLKWAKSTFALLPGLLIIATNLGVPPGVSHLLLGGIIEACGGFTLIVLKLKTKDLQQIEPKKLERLAILFFSLFLLALLGYLLLFQLQVIYNATYDQTVFFPFWQSVELQFMIGHAGSKNAAIDSYGVEAVLQATKNPGIYLALTMIAFVLIYLLVFECLTIGFGLLAGKRQSP